MAILLNLVKSMQTINYRRHAYGLHPEDIQNPIFFLMFLNLISLNAYPEMFFNFTLFVSFWKMPLF